MPRKQTLTRRKGKKQSTGRCSGQSIRSVTASTEFSQASDTLIITQITQITNTTIPDSWMATPTMRPRPICTCNNQPGPSVTCVHEVETGDDIQKDYEQSNCSIRTISAITTQATQESDRTMQVPNTIPDSWTAKSPKRTRPNCTCNQPGTSADRCLLHENIEEGGTENAKCICEKQASSTNARCPLHRTIRGDIDIIDDNNIPEGCICYEPGPANQRCPLHEIEPANDDIVIDDPFNDSFTEILEAVDFHTPQDNNPPQPADEIDILPPIPHQVGAADYLLATTRQNIEVHNCGHLDQNCLHCNAKYFALERNSRGTYNKCCSGGNVFLAPFTQHPQELRRLFTGQHPLSREFKRNINVYNNCFQFASVQANLREIPGQGPLPPCVRHTRTDIPPLQRRKH
ncbi:hypothetical protein QE152_g37229 [Popillia japonica]|uniref:Uncharacterized protein n=1 Tax=Popillia japonica TaxID=7064 RepID=A0AAW1IAI3_POPJA